MKQGSLFFIHPSSLIPYPFAFLLAFLRPSVTLTRKAQSLFPVFDLARLAHWCLL